MAIISRLVLTAAISGHNGIGGHSLEIAANENWLNVTEKHPDRFLSTSDYLPSIAKKYPANIRHQRGILDTFSPAPAISSLTGIPGG